MKLRLYAGTINNRPDSDEWRNVSLDVTDRGVWDPVLHRPVQPDFVCDIASTPFENSVFDEVILHHVLEHMHLDHGYAALDEISRILKPGGVLDIEVPDAAEVCARWLAGEMTDESFMQWTYGEQLSEHKQGDSHRYGWTERPLREALAATGFSAGDRMAAGLAIRLRALSIKEPEEVEG